MIVKIMPSPRKTKKYRAIFSNPVKIVDFGAKGMSDYTIHKDLKRKELFLSRFSKLIEQYKYDPTAPMTLSKWILWNKPTLEASIKDYNKFFYKVVSNNFI